MRNYFNAIVKFRDDGTTSREIFKVGEEDVSEDMHVFDYLESENDIPDLLKNGRKDYEVLEMWRGIREEDRKPSPCDPDEFEAFMNG